MYYISVLIVVRVTRKLLIAEPEDEPVILNGAFGEKTAAFPDY